MGISPQFFCTMSLATRSRVVPGEQHAGSGVITSRASLAMRSSVLAVAGSSMCFSGPEYLATEGPSVLFPRSAENLKHSGPSAHGVELHGSC